MPFVQRPHGRYKANIPAGKGSHAQESAQITGRCEDVHTGRRFDEPTNIVDLVNTALSVWSFTEKLFFLVNLRANLEKPVLFGGRYL